MKVLAIFDSSRNGCNSDVLCDQFLKGVMEAGHSTRKIRLAEKEIKPCRACYACSKQVDVFRKMMEMKSWQN